MGIEERLPFPLSQVTGAVLHAGHSVVEQVTHLGNQGAQENAEIARREIRTRLAESKVVNAEVQQILEDDSPPKQ